MTPKDKGKFCGSCSKTVVDFTHRFPKEIQNFILENKKERICGHFYKKQLDTIIIEIPQITFHQQLSFQKLFVLILFFVMGTTLFSCQYSEGKKQKIKNVIIKDSLNLTEDKLDFIIPIKNTINSHKIDTNRIIVPSSFPENIIVGKAPINVIEGIIALDYETEEIGFISIEEPPRFKKSKNLSTKNAKKDFDSRMKKFVEENFDKNLH
ncbi:MULTISPECIES: hypothetical protein [unclassified Polaribacter]|uniref:hypothetical protein n=1 Tax=unclassified Polaribacter TaxID=196858 RepID=UPI0011BEC054|nr:MULTISPECIES: hypothetical protein [unclassified Polaribacter]TXD54204.1 hypothetical protein ES043_01515 [Polaribacter sp. IC063]TXD62469.1 hypothetical protein ES044_01725 [Polaribacter sp. IC066]